MRSLEFQLSKKRKAALAGVAVVLALSTCLAPAHSGAAEDQAGHRPESWSAEGVVTMNAVSLQFVDYRNDPDELAGRVDRMLSEAPPPPREGSPVGLVVPHAGYIYSGPIAAHGYRAIQGKEYDTVVVIGPSHRTPFRGVSILNTSSFDSPLGSIPCDRPLIESLMAAHDGISYLPEAHSQEHSLEVQIPFLQRSLSSFELVMAVIGGADPAAEEAFVRLLAGEKEKKILLVASSDFSHYYPYGLANRMDRLAIDSVLALDGEGLNRKIGAQKCELCGIRPVLTVMDIVRKMGVRKGILLRQGNSGDTAGPRDRVVGYATVAFYPEGGATGEEGGAKEKSTSLNPSSRKELLAIARQAIEEVVKTGHAPEPSTANPALMTPQGAFVTIKINGRLRGCIGNFGIRNAKPLFRTVSEMAVAAAVHDPRFRPLSTQELPAIKIEISALSPLQPVTGIEEIQVGRHGIYITKGMRSGVLLPQVATENGWDRNTFLEQTCRKAGLAPGEWKEGAVISIFSAEVFNEH